jgi:hypothetical protein
MEQRLMILVCMVCLCRKLDVQVVLDVGKYLGH